MLSKRWTRRAIHLVAVLAVGALCIPAAAGASTSAAKKATAGGTLTVLVANEIPSFSPYPQRIGSLTQGGDRTFAVFDTILKIDPKTNAPVPNMGTVTTDDGGSTWIMKLKPDIKFSDGSPLNADAVVFTWKLLQDPANSFLSRAVVGAARSFRAVDAQTVEFKLVEPDGQFNQIFTDIPGVVLSPTGYAAAGSPTAYFQKPVAAGPFMVESWQRDQQLTLVKNPNYWNKPKPYLDKLIFKIVPDRNTQTNLLNQGQADVILLARGPQLIEAQKNNNLQYADPTKQNGSYGLLSNQAKAPGNDIRWRQAMQTAFDFKVSNQILNGGLPYGNKLQCMPFGPASPLCAKDVVLKYDPKKTQKLLDEYRADGNSTDVTLLYNGADQGSGVIMFGEYVQQQLAKYGVKVTLRNVTTAQFTPIQQTQKDYQVAISYIPSATYPELRYYDFYHSVGGTKGGTDVPSANNAALDVALEKGRFSVKRADQIAGWQEAQRIYHKEAISTWMVPQPLPTIALKTVNFGPEQTINSSIIRFDAVSTKAGK